MKKGDSLNYFSKPVTVLDLNQTHCLIQFEDGSKICTTKNIFKK